MEMPKTDDLPIACDLTALDAEVRSVHMETARQLLNEGAQEVRELPDGRAFRYAAEQYAQVTQFIANERLCCPFFTFVLEVTPGNGPIWLRITGHEGVKDLLLRGDPRPQTVDQLAQPRPAELFQQLFEAREKHMRAG